jgi:hypothetical protein
MIRPHKIMPQSYSIRLLCEESDKEYVLMLSKQIYYDQTQFFTDTRRIGQSDSKSTHHMSITALYKICDVISSTTGCS